MGKVENVIEEEEMDGVGREGERDEGRDKGWKWRENCGTLTHKNNNILIKIIFRVSRDKKLGNRKEKKQQLYMSLKWKGKAEKRGLGCFC